MNDAGLLGSYLRIASPDVMRWRAVTVLLVIGAVGFGPGVVGKAKAVTAPAQGQTDLVLILDTSKTMRGLASGSNIFGQVKTTCKELVKDLATGDTVTLIPFDSEARPQPTVTLVTETEHVRVFELVDSLRADGNWTYTARALEQGLKEAERLEAAFPGHNQVVAILTDGLNDPPPAMRGIGPTLEQLTRPYAGKPWYVFQIQLGPEIDRELSNAIAVFPRGQTIHDPRGVGLASLPRKLQPPPPPSQVVLAPTPSSVHLRITALSQQASGIVTVPLPSDLTAKDLHATVGMTDTPGELTTDVVVVGVGGGNATVQVNAETRKKIPDGTYSGRLTIALAESALAYRALPCEVPISIGVALVTPSWPYWLGGMFALIAVLVAVALMRRWLLSRRLFGQLEAWPQDRPQDVSRFSDLSTFGSEAAIGSEQVILRGVDRRLGTLCVKSVEGTRHVVAKPAASERLLHDGRTELELPLYDADSFELGGWVFCYRGEVARRHARNRA